MRNPRLSNRLREGYYKKISVANVESATVNVAKSVLAGWSHFHAYTLQIHPLTSKHYMRININNSFIRDL